MIPARGKSFFCSWSGGKDSCLALYCAIQAGAVPRALLTMLTRDGARSRSHGLPVSVLNHQALALKIPLVVRESSWDDYEQNFTEIIHRFRKEGMVYGVFGDIDLEDHFQWVERVCSAVGIRACEPLWKRPRRELMEKFFNAGFSATIIAVKEGVLDRGFLGRTLDRDLVRDLEKTGIDASGEEGEYHTVVTNGPIFRREIPLEQGKSTLRGGYSFLEISVASTP